MKSLLSLSPQLGRSHAACHHRDLVSNCCVAAVPSAAMTPCRWANLHFPSRSRATESCLIKANGILFWDMSHSRTDLRSANVLRGPSFPEIGLSAVSHQLGLGHGARLSQYEDGAGPGCWASLQPSSPHSVGPVANRTLESPAATRVCSDVCCP